MARGTFKRLGFYILGAVVVLAILGLLAAWMYVRAGYPDYNQNIASQDLTEGATIERDERGVAYISARNMSDLYFAQGYVHAQERLWQMDFQRRVVQGRLSEIFGESQLDADRFLRTIGLQRIAERLLEHTSEEGLKVLQSYADGVNAYLADANSLPLEFRVLGANPERWEPIHSTAMIALMAYDLGDNWRSEALRMRLQSSLSDTLFQEILPPYDRPTRPVLIETPGDDALLSLHEKSQLGGLLPFLPRTGSNSWVVAPERSESGNALLGNDPHLSLNLPVLWYENQLTVVGELNVYGWSIPGGPGVVIGHNDAISWGFTNTGDSQDLFIEEIDPSNSERFRDGDDWYDGEVITEEIWVDGRDEPVTHRVRMTRNGPLVEDNLSLRWTAYDIEANTFDAILGINRAHDWESFRAATEHFVLPAQNVVFADTAGTIAFRTVGNLPTRGFGDGIMPLDGTDSDQNWQGYIPFEEMPEAVNPDYGFLATANHRVELDEFPHLITREYGAHYRMQRIVDVLEANGSVTMDDMAALQHDWHNLLAEERLPELLSLLGNEELNEAEREGVAILRDWLNNPVNRREDAAPALFQVWYLELMEAIFRPEMGNALYRSFIGRGTYAYNTTAHILDQEESAWLPDGLQPVAQSSFSSAFSRLQDQLGRSPENWRWEDLQQLHLEHVMGESAAMRSVVNKGPYPYGGDQVTVGRSGYSLTEPFKVVHGAGLRFLAEMSSPINARAVLAGGQSGHPRHRHYDDQVQTWLEGGYYELHGDTGDRKVLQLTPE